MAESEKLIQPLRLEGLYTHIKASPDIIINRFKKAGIYQAIQDPQFIQDEIDEHFSDLMKTWTSMSL